MNTIENCWRIIEQFLKEYSPNTYETLAPPASALEIEKLKKEINLPIPDSLVQSLLINNGQNDESRIYSLIDYHHFLSCEDIISTYNMMNDIFPDEDIVDYIEPSECAEVRIYYIWNKRWLPITDSNGDGLMIDFDPSETGIEGQVFYRPNSGNPPDKCIARSHEEWMIRICEKLQQGDFRVDDGTILINNFTYDW